MQQSTTGEPPPAPLLIEHKWGIRKEEKEGKTSLKCHLHLKNLLEIDVKRGLPFLES